MRVLTLTFVLLFAWVSVCAGFGADWDDDDLVGEAPFGFEGPEDYPSSSRMFTVGKVYELVGVRNDDTGVTLFGGEREEVSYSSTLQGWRLGDGLSEQTFTQKGSVRVQLVFEILLN